MKRILKWLLIGILLVGTVALGVRSYRALSGPGLQPWHTFVPIELTAGELDAADLEVLQQRVLERSILPLDETALGSLQRQANVLADLGLIPERVNVRDATRSLLMRQNWTY